MTIIYVRGASSERRLGDPAYDAATQARCTSCDDEIRGQPLIREGRSYCCEGCADGGPCNC